MATPTYIGTYIGAPPGVRQRLTAVPARPCQWKLYRGIQCALEATIPDLYDTYSGGTIRPFKQAMAGRLPSRLADWFEAELKDAAAREILSFSGTPELLGPGWLAALTTTRRFVIEHEITAGKVTQLLVGARSPNPLRPEAPTAIAHVCTIQAMQYEAWRLQGKQRTVRANADRRRFTEAVALLRRQLPDWIRLVDMGSTRFDSYCALLDQLNALPSLPRLGRANFDWQTC